MNDLSTFEGWRIRLNALLEARLAEYPARGTAHAALSEALQSFAAWLGEQPPPLEPDKIALAEHLTPIFVGGFYKSGTTFVLNLLDGHPALSALPGDAKLYQMRDTPLPDLGAHWVHVLVNPTGLPPFWLFGTESKTPYAAFLAYLRHSHEHGHPIEAVPWAYAAANPYTSPTARFWVDKTPLQELHTPALVEQFPQARFVHVVRNPLAVLAAMQKIAHTRGERFRLAHMVEQMHSSLRAGLAHQKRYGQRYTLLRYEDIIAQPEDTMRDLAGALSIDFDQSLLRPTINGQPSTSNSAYRENRTQGEIQSASLERWREQLTRSQIERIAVRLGPLAAAYGYDFAEVTPRGLHSTLRTTEHALTAHLIDPARRLGARISQAVHRRL